MAFLATLWLPIVLSAIFVFLASSIMHMILPYHRSDYRPLPDDDNVRAALRAAGLTPGLYVFPFCAPKDMKSPEMVEKYKQGPVGTITVVPSAPPFMPKFLAMWFGFCLLVGFSTAYLAGHTVPVGANYRVVFRVVGATSFMAYGLANLSSGIWKMQSWSMTIKEVVDGLVYALLTAGTFGWLWPR